MTRRAPRAVPTDPAKDSGIGFSDPPELTKDKYDWEDIAEKCRAQPMDYYHVFTGGLRSTAMAVMQNKVAVLREDRGFEGTTRNNNRVVEPPTCDFYVRYNPTKDRSN